MWRQMTKEDTAQRLAFVGLGDEERSYLTALQPLLERHADTLVGAFYRHLLSFERTRTLLRDPEVKGRLLAKQRAYLRQSERRARAAEDLASVATLVAGLAHEIGTPMGVIQGHAELLESSVSDERGRWRLRTIREQIERISRIIQALLNTARPRDPVLLPVSVAPILDNSLSFLAEKFRRRGVEVERHVTEAPEISGDSEKLQQLFLNLLLNAVDAMPEGGRIVVSVGTDSDGALEVRIRDSGIGIPQEQLSQIFQPFYTTKEAGHGSGLGLVVAREIVADHGGEIDVASDPGEGTEFRIRFPPLGLRP